MIFKITELKKFMSSVAKQKIESVRIQGNHLELTINLVKRTGVYLPNNSLTNHSIESSKKEFRQKINSKEEVDKSVKQDRNTYFTIVSPMIGTFYRSPAPNEAPFVSTDDPVKINQTVCIIEAMKLMNEIESEVNGNIVEILAQDGDIVDCGQPLMRIKQKKPE
jgi:acetyl-CoA carboxylase biotin carboxyl carrier protein